GVPFHYPAKQPAYLETVAARLLAQGVTAVPERRQGMAAVEIGSLARELDAGLICMTTEGRPEALPGMGRSVAAEVIRSAPCPVYVRRMSGVAGMVGCFGAVRDLLGAGGGQRHVLLYQVGGEVDGGRQKGGFGR